MLDAVLADLERTWLATERDKLAHFQACTTLTTEEMPRLVFRGPDGSTTMRISPIRLPIGCHQD